MDTQKQQGSNFTLYVGIAVEDREVGSTKLKVSLPEMTPFFSGEVKDTEDNVQVSSGGSNQGGDVTLTNNITADYFNIIPNRRYPPDIKRNEQVIILNYADSDLYYWFGLGRDDFLRKLERYNISVSDNPTAVDSITNENSYYFEMDTVNKHIKIVTTNSDGEQYRYSFIIDTKNNTVTICDDGDNEIVLESAIPRIYVKNRNGAVVDLSKNNITISAPDDVLIKSGRQIVFETATLTSNVSNGTVFNTTDCAVNASGSSVTNAPCIGLQGQSKIESILSGPIVAQGYAVGGGVTARNRSMTRSATPTPQYTATMSNVLVGESTSPGNSASVVNTSVGRHCTAWEEMQQAIYKLADALDKIAVDSDHPGISDLTSSARSLADASIMNKNRGE